MGGLIVGNFFEKNRDKIFKKYDDETICKDILSYKFGSGNLTKTLNQFFEELIFCSCGKGSGISPMDVLLDDAKIEEIFEYISTKPKFYTGDDITNLKSYFRNAVSWVRKVANFPPGFGSRMSATLISGHNYCALKI